jgi:hypothetical protein
MMIKITKAGQTIVIKNKNYAINQRVHKLIEHFAHTVLLNINKEI